MKETPKSNKRKPNLHPIYAEKKEARPAVNRSDLLVFSHLRWDFVFQRPQHLLTRHAKFRRVFFVEEPIYGDFSGPSLHVSSRDDKLKVVVPHIPHGLNPNEVSLRLRGLLDHLLSQEQITSYSAWYYTPMALSFTSHLKPECIIYDCMDELSLFKGAPDGLLENEDRLLKLADVVFTGGQSLFEAKQALHSNIHPFPSSIDGPHFRRAREKIEEPQDQAGIPGPRLGFFGVIDERMDIELVDKVAQLRPDWNIVIIGPVVKIDPSTLPKHKNIHYLGKKDYQELPSYLSGWDLAFLPFARNDSTRFISPTKTPEYLSAGCPVVSTSIRDVVRPYEFEKLVYIADTAEEFVAAAERAMQEAKESEAWIQRVDRFLAKMSWDETFANMASLEIQAKEAKAKALSIVQSAASIIENRLGA